jgi:aryl-alcohol dehydrogenase (NADP+)
MARLDGTDLDVFPLCLGGNVFGWTADEDASIAVLDAYAEAGGNFIDTADTYMRPNMGISETIIGRWMAARGNRDEMVIATKVGSDGGLSAANIAAHAEGSLRRLQTDRIDLYYSHKDDLDVPVEETLEAFNALVEAGKVRHIAASNLSGERIAESLRASAREGWARYVALQPHYNLVERERYEREYAPLAAEHGLAVAPYYALAKGFLTGKYRDDSPAVDSPRAEGARAYLDDRGRAVLADLEEIADAHGVPMAAIALAWLKSRPNVVAPIASARSVEQLEHLLPMVEVTLTGDELLRLETASR